MSNSARIVSPPLPDPCLVGFPLDPLSDLPSGEPLTLAVWLRHWLDSAVAPYRARTTVYCYTNIVENHLIPALGKVHLSQLTPELINQYYHWLLTSQRLSPNTVRKHHILLHTSLQHAFRQGVLQTNPVQRAVPPSSVPGQAKYYTPQQLAHLLNVVRGHPLELPVNLACYLGLRRSEILGLRWRDVDLQSGRITVRQVRTSMGHEVVEKAPKTRDSCRTLSIAPLQSLMTLLDETHRYRLVRGIPCGGGDPVILDSRRHPWHPNTLSATFACFISSHGLPPITLHGLRHTFASVASSARVPLYEISRALGHSNPSTTQRIYTHLFDLTHGEVLAAVAAAIPADLSEPHP